jgi:hypothetical protein
MKMPVKIRIVSITCCITLFALNAWALSAEPSAFHIYSAGGSLVLSVALLVITLVNRGERPAPEPPKANTAEPKPVPAATNQAEAEIVSFLAVLQERGRLVDFLMEDVTTYDDAQVGAAARVVHEGCKAALREHFDIQSVREENEGSSVTVPAVYATDEYRLIGSIRGAGPFAGTLIHRGWKTGSVKLPRIVRVDPDRLPTIAPAEVELNAPCSSTKWTSAGSRYSDLRGAAVDEQLNPGDVGAVVGSEEHRRFAKIIRRGEPAERNRCNHRRFFLICHKMREAGCIGVSGAQYVYADVAPLEVDYPGAGERAYRGLCRVVVSGLFAANGRWP